MSDLTYLVYKDPGVSFVFDETNDYRKVICSSSIKKGELITIEHCLFQRQDDPSDYLTRCVKRNDKLYRSLYPRRYETNIEQKKVESNRFGIGDMFILGLYTSSFNSSFI